MMGFAHKLGAVLTGTVLAFPGGTVLPGGGAAAQPKIAWAPCAANRAVECGELRVPVDWGRPGGARFGLAVARLKAAEPGRRIGVLVVNVGGGPGTDFVQGEASTYFSKEILARFDIVGLDPRGVGGSSPVRCSADIVRREPLPTPRDQADFDRLRAYAAELAADCRRRTGPVADHLDAVSVARDLDAVRAALGERTISYHGVSAGTLPGQHYAELFGRNLRAMSLDSVLDHSLPTGRFLVSQAANAEDAFLAFARWCARDRACALHGRDVPRIWDGLMARADRGTLRDPALAGRVLSAYDLATEAHLGGLMGPDHSWLAERIASLESGRPGPRGIVRGQPGPEVREIEHPAPAACQDWRLTIPDHRRFAAHAAKMRQVAPHMRTQPDTQAFALTCALWPVKPRNPQHRLKVPAGTPPILLVNARHDPAAGHAWAVGVRRQLGRGAALVTYEGAGHGAYQRTACTRRAVDDYLLHLHVPTEGRLTCGR
ncbi:pimeloyl-ACP methyl ester carboxylesterase [Thermocatellispora tengchongensis]|uniref:Pimeloyl-ACP methyl ester carboxylesterase n=1 Tax=Thermocatellispora tengchongensis TaxID=1073253 RepID=A0A840PD55_9ACTN|nr:alpha/beta hydrolase [Thermocatellispora tengchongensis]MBB5133965.1 pimeloyl-ACP methyl ester carboxylesterase [Thermocatellispora tengchongensis]